MHAPWHPASGLLYPSLVSYILYPVPYFQSPVSSVLMHLVSSHASCILSFILWMHTVSSILQHALFIRIKNPAFACCPASFIRNMCPTSGNPASLNMYPAYSFLQYPAFCILNVAASCVLHPTSFVLYLASQEARNAYCILNILAYCTNYST